MTTKNNKPNQPAPRYDDVHADGVAWLDEDPRRDDDLRLVAFIEQSAAEIERLKRDLEGVKEREREHVTRAQDVADEMRRERDAAIAERDDLKRRVRLVESTLVAFIEQSAAEIDRIRVAETERDRLRRELEALRDSLRTNLAWGHSKDVDAFWHELDAILRGES